MSRAPLHSSIFCAATRPGSSSRPRCRQHSPPAHAIRHLKVSQVERTIHQQRVTTLKRSLVEAGFVLIRDPILCKAACDELLLRHRIYVQPINFPTVPRGTERLRLTPSPLHSDEDIEALVTGLGEVWTRLTLGRAA
jgi:5-aminolevulinate synthase